MPTKQDVANRRTYLKRLVVVALSIIAINRLLAVNIIPVITNDSVGYLSHAQNAFGDGLVWSGYRQFGYPMFLAIVRMVADVVQLEPILLVAALQRTLLGLACAYVIWQFRWWSIPAVFIATSPDIVAYTNLILTEGLAIPLTLLYGGLITHAMLTVTAGGPDQPGTDGSNDRSFTPMLLASASLLVVFLTAVKYQSAALTLPLVVLIALAIRRSDLRRRAIGIGAALVAAMLLLSVGMALENHNEYDDLFPISRGVRNSYWGTYQVVFNLNPSNQSNADLAVYYADGNTFSLIREIEGTIQDYPSQRAAFEEAIEIMLDEAGLDKRTEQFNATWGAIRGGRLDDIRGIIARTINSSTATVVETIHSNSISASRGIDTYVSGYNHSRTIEPVMTAALFHSFVDWHARDILAWSGPAALLVLALGAALSIGKRTVFLAAAASALAIMGLTGLLIVDNFRYIIAAHIFLLPFATLATMLVSTQTRNWMVPTIQRHKLTNEIDTH